MMVGVVLVRFYNERTMTMKEGKIGDEGYSVWTNKCNLSMPQIYIIVDVTLLRMEELPF